jgi:hypothetical protein
MPVVQSSMCVPTLGTNRCLSYASGTVAGRTARVLAYLEHLASFADGLDLPDGPNDVRLFRRHVPGHIAVVQQADLRLHQHL